MILLEIFAFGTVGFWALCALVWILLTAAVEFEKPGLATFSLLVAFGALSYFGIIDVQALISNPWMVVKGVSGYLLGGLIWAACKWVFYVRSVGRKYDDDKRQFLESQTPPIEGMNIPDDFLEKWQQHIRYRPEIKKPNARNSKARIMTWMVYWPWSFVWTMIDDPIKNAFHSILHWTQGMFQRVSDQLWGNRDEDFRAPPPKKAEPVPEESPDGYPSQYPTRQYRGR